MTFHPMRTRLLLLSLPLVCSLTGTARAQWKDITYTVQPGQPEKPTWSAIWLPGDATWGTVESVLDTANRPLLQEVWRWNVNASPFQFTTDPATPAAATPEWLYWKRDGDSATNTLRQLPGQNAYLVKFAAGATGTFTIRQRMLPPNVVWQRTGANLLGFPARADLGASNPKFAAYFAGYPPAIAAGTRVFKYVGGDLAANANPLRILNLSTETLDPTQAYWFDTQTVSDFDAPIEVSTSTGAGFDFGASQDSVTLQLRNRSNAPITITVVENASAPAPAGQPELKGRVPLMIPKSGTTTLTALTVNSSITRTIAAQTSDLVRVSIDRTSMKRADTTPGVPGDAFGSLLRITDSTNLLDIYLPVSAQVRSNAGLWVGDASVSRVDSKVAGATGKTVAAPFPLRLIVHVDQDGKVTLLQQVFSGLLAATPYATGLCTAESLLKQDAKASASRFMAAHLPLDFKKQGSVTSGTTTTDAVFTLGTSPTVTWKVTIPFDSESNPFVHQYHPDHDNLDARFVGKLPDGNVDTTKAESWTVERSISMGFAATAPAGVSPTGYGSTVLAGTFKEAITGLRKNGAPDAAQSTHNVEGTFLLRRVSDTATYSIP